MVRTVPGAEAGGQPGPSPARWSSALLLSPRRLEACPRTGSVCPVHCEEREVDLTTSQGEAVRQHPGGAPGQMGRRGVAGGSSIKVSVCQ